MKILDSIKITRYCGTFENELKKELRADEVETCQNGMNEVSCLVEARFVDCRVYEIF